MNKIFPIILALVIISCSNSENKEQSTAKTKKESTPLYVDTLHLTKQTFNKQIVCNGKLRAVLKSDIAFASSGIISTINVKNGDNVSSGSLLAIIDTQKSQTELSKAQQAMEKANLDLIDKLIGQGFDEDTSAVPQQMLNNAKFSSGYNSALNSLNDAKRNLSDCYLKAPFAGRIANMDSKVYDKSKELFCTLIDDSYFDVEFSILEAELGEVEVGQEVTASPFINDKQEFKGKIEDINPFIDDKGQIKVRARIKNTNNYLVEGMNIKLVLNRKIENQFVVPRSAVVLRDGFHIIFRYIDGEAVWTYVDVVTSNIESHLITGHAEKETTINEKDVIITSGNTNLADGVKVKIKE